MPSEPFYSYFFNSILLQYHGGKTKVLMK